jgi:inner membrane protein
MEPVTHFLFGAAMGRAGLNRKTALATATLTLAAEAPDLDVLSRFGGSAFGLNHHRGFTHSFLGVPLVAAVVVGFIYLLWRLRGRKTRNPNLPPRWGLLFAYACLAGFSHILLDFTNNYGVRPFWPFSERWISWDIVFIVEPVILVVLTLGLILPALFALINEEIGARSKDANARGKTSRDSSSARRFRLLGTARLRTSPRRSRSPVAQLSGCRCDFEFPRTRTGSIRSVGTES